ncbi:pyrroline-5-carboxylate reductase [Granulicella cerasi]|uniref:Pyrroline-5-carboxylate reductase n=1 Tax=Granulicella cerasi TaxID=741063 RepID=A0ABW1ZEQ8_9BACT|nr:pyrroline-5-carboxylate reductase [Granulicella cerasi]
MSSNQRIAVLGLGKMSGILLQAFLKQGLFQPAQIAATVAHEERATTLAAQLGINVSTNNVEAARGADVVLLGVKPTQIEDLAREIAPVLPPHALVLSIAASTKLAPIEKALGTEKPAVVRAMPNTPAKVGAGITALCRGHWISDEQLALAEKIFQTVGRTVVVDEKHMDAVTGLSGSGPAFIYIILEALAEAGVNVGLPRDIATMLAAQTTFGAAKMVLETGAHPAVLKDEVTTPAGCTVDGIMELEAGGVRHTLIKTVKRAAERAKELAGN